MGMRMNTWFDGDPAVVADSVASSGAAPDTLTDSVTAPSSSATSIRGDSPALSSMPVRTWVRKPAASTLSSYLPGFKYGTLNRPVSLVSPSDVNRVSALIAVTLAPDKIDPVGSVTIPARVPVLAVCCAWMLAAANTRRNILFRIEPPIGFVSQYCAG